MVFHRATIKVEAAIGILASVLSPAGCGGSFANQPDAAVSDSGTDAITSTGGTMGNLWVDVDGGSCTRSSTLVEYDGAAACPSLDAAYAAAELGDTVIVNGGTYPSQTITEKAGKDGTIIQPHVVFMPMSGDVVSIHGIDLGTGSGGGGDDGPDHITLRGFVMPPSSTDGCYIWVRPDSHDIHIEAVDVCSFGITGVDSAPATWPSNIVVKDSDFGPCPADWSTCTNSRVEASNNLTIDHNVFHDYTRSLDTQHYECLVIWSAAGTEGLHLSRNRFSHCAVFDVALYHETTTVGITPVLVENNFFGHPTDIGTAPAPMGQAAVMFKNVAPFPNTTFRNNSFAPGGAVVWNSVGSNNTWTSSKEVGDLGEPDCQTATVGVTYSYNVETSGTCAGTGNVMVSTLSDLYIDAVAGDFHLAGSPGSTVADGRVPAVQCPAIDIDGDPRPTTGFCDAGADER
ncbi:MAG: hypothetical protein JWO36_3152 [Myxococcales bacterium]|nr:hypothetical protein [Myxococcales bacterium]